MMWFFVFVFFNFKSGNTHCCFLFWVSETHCCCKAKFPLLLNGLNGKTHKNTDFETSHPPRFIRTDDRFYFGDTDGL